MIGIMLRAAVSTEGGSRWVRRVTNPNGEVPVRVPVLLWALFFGITLQLVPHEGAGSPYGAIGLIALFIGFFIMMGFLWAVIGD